jgi:hypothetical protein
MTEKEKDDGTDKLVDAYDRMLRSTHAHMEKAPREESPAFRELLDKTREALVEGGELTREAATKAADYLERDIKEAARYIAETGEDLKKWWRFDRDLVEARLLEMFSRVADQTSLQLHAWEEQARRASRYRTGEISGPGTLVCSVCGAELHTHKTGRIPPCPKCHATEFTRAPGREGS